MARLIKLTQATHFGSLFWLQKKMEHIHTNSQLCEANDDFIPRSYFTQVPGYNSLIPNHCCPQYLSIWEHWGQHKPGNKARLAKQVIKNCKWSTVKKILFSQYIWLLQLCDYHFYTNARNVVLVKHFVGSYSSGALRTGSSCFARAA